MASPRSCRFHEAIASHPDSLKKLLRGGSSLTRGERELIATHVSWRNDCYFRQTIHGAVAAAQLNHDEALVQKVKTDWETANISPKLKALLKIAGKVQQDGKLVSEEDVSAVRAHLKKRIRSQRRSPVGSRR